MDDRSPLDPEGIPEDLVPLVKPELQPGERLLWASKAGTGVPSTVPGPSTAAWIWFLGFATVSVGSFFGLPVMWSKHREGPDGAVAVLGIASGVIAFFFAVGFLSIWFSRRAERRKLEGHVYALTDRRALIWMPMARSAVSVHTFQRGTIKGEDLHRIQHVDGSGDVVFRASYQHPAGFFGIAEVRRVEELVRRFLVVPGLGTARVEDINLD